MPAYYLETSALFKRYRTEPGSNVVRELFDLRRPDETLSTSYLSVLELTSTASRLMRGRVIRASQYAGLIRAFRNDIAGYRIDMLPVEDALVDEAINLYPGDPLRGADALHFASALRVNAVTAPDFYLVSGDRELGNAARRHRLKVLDPEDAGALAYLRSIR